VRVEKFCFVEQLDAGAEGVLVHLGILAYTRRLGLFLPKIIEIRHILRIPVCV
jgi:hypothetical protein